jgi:hypothetical protein
MKPPRTFFTFAVVCGMLWSGQSLAQVESTVAANPTATNLLARLRPGHPRLLVSTQDWARLKIQITTQQQAKEWHAKLHTRADRVLRDPPSRYEIPDGLRLLSTSRRVLDRVYTLALLYRLELDNRYVQRAWQELDAAAHFPDWNPRHFLDTAEMTHAFAIAYDWLYDVWTPGQRDTIRDALLQKGLTLGVECYRSQVSHGWWTKAHHNWNQVCNGGIGIGALALADEAPQLAEEFLRHALESIQLPMAQFAPDGAWNEGPGYWNYATSYNVVFLAALQSALGTDFGLSKMTGFADTGLFPMYLTGPLGRTFNYADGGEGAIHAPQMFWLADKCARPVYAWYERQVASPAALDLVWFNPKGSGPAASGLALDKYFRGVEVVSFRSAWEDRNALFAGFKAGDNQANHSNLDLGSFVLDALGQRWAVDLGADDYNLPGYFGGQRWQYYRMRAEGHNTLVLNPGADPDQDPKAAARIVRFESKPQRAFAIADLTPAYAKHARQVQRGIALLDRKQILVQDEVQAQSPSEVWWFMHTPAQVELSSENTQATLTLGDARLVARLLLPAAARFVVMDTQPLPTSPHPEKQARNQGLRKLAVHLTGAQDVRLMVLLTPLTPGMPMPSSAPESIALEKW